jgi:hypothetical protein
MLSGNYVSDFAKLSEINSTLDTTLSTLYDKVCQRLAAGRWFYMGTSIPSTKNTDRHDIAEILLKVALNTITLYINSETL